MAGTKGTQRKYRSPLREEAARRTREAVVVAAAEVFVREGYTGATIEQVAARAGVSRPTVFGVGNKAQLFALARQRAATGGRLTANDVGFQHVLATDEA
ncbi:MAG TPA: TetR family transcriptional regulator, partial [Trebonia sp.]|nr:TetR family transcriptional regulator [Trebonia sp.]